MSDLPETEELARLRELALKATAGPWCWQQCGEKVDAPVVGIAYLNDDVDCKNPLSGLLQDCDSDGNEIEYYRESIAYEIESCDGCSASSNAAFIAAANPATILALIDGYREQAEKIGRLSVVLRELLNEANLLPTSAVRRKMLDAMLDAAEALSNNRPGQGEEGK